MTTKTTKNLTPAQKAAETRKRNKAAKEKAAKAVEAAKRTAQGTGVQVPRTRATEATFNGKPVLLQFAHGPVRISCGGKGKKEDIRPMPFKNAFLLAVLIRHAENNGDPMPKGGNEGAIGAPGSLLYEAQRFGFGQSHIGKNGCGMLAAGGFATREKADFYDASASPGAAYYTRVTEYGKSITLVRGDDRLPLTTILDELEAEQAKYRKAKKVS